MLGENVEAALTSGYHWRRSGAHTPGTFLAWALGQLSDVCVWLFQPGPKQSIYHGNLKRSIRERDGQHLGS